MSIEKISYYQFYKGHPYSIFIKFDDIEIERPLLETLRKLCLEKVVSDKFKDLRIDKNKTKILKISMAQGKALAQIDRSFYAVENLGNESISPQGQNDIYRYRSVGVMSYPHDGLLAELAIKKVAGNEEAIMHILTRFLSLALVNYKVVGLWGTPIEEGLVVMRPNLSKGECVFIDVERMSMMTRDGEKQVDGSTQFLRLDTTLTNDQRSMKPEDLLSFLTTHTTYFSYKGLETQIKFCLIKLAQTVKGVVYPKDNFRNRSNLQLP